MIADKVIKLRKSAGWSQSELARQAGVTSAAISKIEAGKSKPTLEVLVKLANVLNVDLGIFKESYEFTITDENSFVRRFAVLNKLSKEDQQLILKIAKRLKNK